MSSLTVMGGRRYDRVDRRSKSAKPRSTYKPSSYLDITQLNQFKTPVNLQPLGASDVTNVVDFLQSIEA